jgi:hypothetical protein
MLSNKRHGIYPGSGRGGRTSSSGALEALYCSAPGVLVVGLLQARRERKAGFQVPGVVSGGVVGGFESKCVAQLVSCCVESVSCVFPFLSLCVRLSVPRGRGVRPPFIDQGGGESHARRAI